MPAGLKKAQEGQVMPAHNWKAGQSGNPKGRPKGAKNVFSSKVKKTLRKIIGEFLTVESLQNDLAAMSPKDRVAAINNYLKYFLTTSKQVNNSYEGNVNVSIQYEKKELAELEDVQDTDDFEIEEED